MSIGRPKVHRREMIRRLRGREDRVSPLAQAGRFDLLKASRPAMGSYFEVRLPASTPGATDLAMKSLDEIDALESQMTVYRETSEISRLNATAHLGPVSVESRLFALLQKAVSIGKATGGAYDVTAGTLSLAWGFTRGPKRVPTPEALADALACTGHHHLIFDGARFAISFDCPGVVVNLGSIGKGYAIDRVADVIRDHFWPTPALIHGGQSSVYALGSPPDRFGGRWEVSFRNPFDATRSLGTLFVRNRAIGTSGALFQRFEQDGRIYGHVIDPRTGYPPESGPASVTVLAPTAAEADAALDRVLFARPAGISPDPGSPARDRCPVRDGWSG